MSEIFVDTIRKTGGSLGTDIRIKNTSVYESDGGTSVTQNLVQGIAKSWISYRGTSTVEIRDSLNVGSLTDNGTGDYTITFTNNMGNNLYPVTMASDHDSGSHFSTACIDHDDPNPVATTQYVANYLDQTNNMRDAVYCHEAVHGDLA